MLDGALHRGLGRGAQWALDDPAAAAPLVEECLHTDWRWDGVDERAVYLARLIRDLGLPVPALSSELPEFDNVLDVLEVLGRDGREGVVADVRRYITDGGEYWQDTLEQVARSWPEAWWDDLRPIVEGRADRQDHPLRVQPWTKWLGPRPYPKPPRPLASATTDELIAMLHSPEHKAAARELRLRPPEPRLLDLIGSIPDPGPLFSHLGVLALPLARGRTPDDPLYWRSLLLLAEHGDTGDVAALAGGLDWLDSRPGDRCGYDTLMEGLARIGGPSAHAQAYRLPKLWTSPHSFERPGYLRALRVLDPEVAELALVEGLWDCEADVRLIAAQHTPLTETTRARLRYLQNDKIETADVRAAAAARGASTE